MMRIPINVAVRYLKKTYRGDHGEVMQNGIDKKQEKDVGICAKLWTSVKKPETSNLAEMSEFQVFMTRMWLYRLKDAENVSNSPKTLGPDVNIDDQNDDENKASYQEDTEMKEDDDGRDEDEDKASYQEDGEMKEEENAEEGDTPNQIDTEKDETAQEDAQDTHGNKYHYDEDVGPDGPHDPRDWKYVRAISDESITKMVLDVVYPDEDSNIHTCQVINRLEGSYNHIVMVNIEKDGNTEQEYVLKIPLNGSKAKWRQQHGFALREEAELMRYIREHTTVPVPKVVDFCFQKNSPLGAPFILMEKLPGKRAENVWFDTDFRKMNQGKRHLIGEVPTEELEKKRTTFLRSLANTMAELNKFEFEQVGVPFIDDNLEVSIIGSQWRWHTTSEMMPLEAIGPFKSSKAFFEAGMERMVEIYFDDDDDEDENEDEVSQQELLNRGIRKFFEIILGCSPFNGNDSESFVLRHEDLNFQNILTDDDGNVTGIVDLDGMMAVPRCIGATTIPLFLRYDWLEINHCDWADLTWKHAHYRDIYTRTMAAATDAKYTAKSPIYQAILACLWDDEKPSDVAMKILQKLPGMELTKCCDFFLKLGGGWPDAEEYLKEQISVLLEP